MPHLIFMYIEPSELLVLQRKHTFAVGLSQERREHLEANRPIPTVTNVLGASAAPATRELQTDHWCGDENLMRAQSVFC